jgi:hypothetical protein
MMKLNVLILMAVLLGNMQIVLHKNARRVTLKIVSYVLIIFVPNANKGYF